MDGRQTTMDGRWWPWYPHRILDHGYLPVGPIRSHTVSYLVRSSHGIIDPPKKHYISDVEPKNHQRNIRAPIGPAPGSAGVLVELVLHELQGGAREHSTRTIST